MTSQLPDTRKEAEIQADFFKNVKLFFPNLPDKLLFHVPNGGARNKIEAAKFNGQGVKSGVADVILLIPRNGFSSLCLEFKTQKGKQSDAQIAFQKQAEKYGSKYVIVRTAFEAIEAIKHYLN